MLDDFEVKMNREVLKYAVQRNIFNDDQTIADVRKSVLVIISNNQASTSKLLSGSHFDSVVDNLRGLVSQDIKVEVHDGRRLFKGNGKGGVYFLDPPEN